MSGSGGMTLQTPADIRSAALGHAIAAYGPMTPGEDMQAQQRHVISLAVLFETYITEGVTEAYAILGLHPGPPQRGTGASAASPARSNGGMARAASLTPERRLEIARRAAAARWGKGNPSPQDPAL